MKILEVNKFYYPKGGAETYFLSLIDLLKSNGHDVVIFSQKNIKNISNDYDNYFIDDIALEKFHWRSAFKIGRIFWSFVAAKKMRELIKIEKPDIAHVHNIYHQISPSILFELKKAGIPIVMTVHDFKLIKADYTLWADGTKKRHKNSFLADILIKAEFYFHRAIGAYKKNVDLFIAPSNFVKEQLVRHGFDMNKIIVQPHFINQPSFEIENNNHFNYAIALGRLDASKGVDTLIEAMNYVKNPLTLKIVGDGPDELQLKKLTSSLSLNHKIEFLGRRPQNELGTLIKNSMFSIFPSRVHETLGLGILESYALGKPVIATRTGAFCEIVKEDKTGILINANKPEELASAIDRLASNPELRKNMGQEALSLSAQFDKNAYHEKIITIFNNTIKQKS